MSGCTVTMLLAGADGKVPSMPSGVRFAPERGGLFDGRAVSATPIMVQVDRSGRAVVVLAPSSVVGDYTVRAGPSVFRIRVPDAPAAAMKDIIVPETEA